MESSNGIRLLSDHSNTEDEATVLRLEKLLHDAKKVGCIEALKKNGHDVRYLTDAKRSSYLDIIKIRNSEDVLEIGSSMGQHTRLIAKQCRNLSAIEIVPKQAAFSRLWCDQDGLQNVEVSAGGMSGALPYEDSSFDVIICNYVLEWCAGRHTGPAEEFHRSFLANIFRTLRPGGRLFLSTKNRYAIRYLLGTEDEHLGIRFGSALPRIIQNFFRRRAELGHPTGYLHSWSALEGILKDVGFSSMDRILAFPDARYPDYLGTFSGFSHEALSKDALARSGRKSRISLRLPRRAFQNTTNSIVLVARKG